MLVEDKNMIKRPCTRVTYSVEVTDLENYDTNSVEFELHFSGP